VRTFQPASRLSDIQLSLLFRCTGDVRFKATRCKGFCPGEEQGQAPSIYMVDDVVDVNNNSN